MKKWGKESNRLLNRKLNGEFVWARHEFFSYKLIDTIGGCRAMEKPVNYVKIRSYKDMITEDKELLK